MRRALRTSRAVAYAVSCFVYLAVEEVLRARAARPPADAGPKRVPSVHEMPTLPGTIPAPAVSFMEAPPPVIRVIAREEQLEAPAPAMPAMPAVLFDPTEAGYAAGEPAIALDVEALLSTLRRDLGCNDRTQVNTHDACRAAEALGDAQDCLDREAVIVALEETVTAAGRPNCVQVAAIASLGRGRSERSGRALGRMLGVTKSRLAWSGTRRERDLSELLIKALCRLDDHG